MKIELTGRNFELDDKIRSYTQDKLGSLEKFIPRGSGGSAHVTVVLEEDVSGREDNCFVCDAVLVVPGARMVAREGTVNMYAAVDIVEAKLQAQLVKHKEKHGAAAHRGRLLSRWTGRSAGEASSPVGEVEP